MQELISEAIVLDREEAGDLDFRVSFFTRRYGKIIAKAKSARKITSKLSGHLNAGNIVQARFVEKGGSTSLTTGNLQVVDALKSGSLDLEPPDLYFLNRILAEGDADARLWQTLISGEFRWPEILKALGWDPQKASCGECRKRASAAFHINSQEFFCVNCVSAVNKKELLYINA